MQVNQILFFYLPPPPDPRVLRLGNNNSNNNILTNTQPEVVEGMFIDKLELGHQSKSKVGKGGDVGQIGESSFRGES